MRSYTTKQACEVLQCTKIQLGQFGDRSKAKIEKNTWNADLVDAELADRKYRLTIQPKVKVKGGEF